MSEESHVMLEAIYVTETRRAVLVEVEGEEEWVPDSEIGEDSQIYVGCKMRRGEPGDIQVARWLAWKKGWI